MSSSRPRTSSRGRFTRRARGVIGVVVVVSVVIAHRHPCRHAPDNPAHLDVGLTPGGVGVGGGVGGVGGGHGVGFAAAVQLGRRRALAVHEQVVGDLIERAFSLVVAGEMADVVAVECRAEVAGFAVVADRLLEGDSGGGRHSGSIIHTLMLTATSTIASTTRELNFVDTCNVVFNYNASSTLTSATRECFSPGDAFNQILLITLLFFFVVGVIIKAVNKITS